MLQFFKEPYLRIKATHFLVILILLTNMLLFTQNQFSLIIQFILMIAIFLHNLDDANLKRSLEETGKQFREDSNIFDRNIVVSESDLEGYITYVNPKFCEISGYSEEELLGKPHNIFRDPETPSKFYQELWDTLKRGETFHGIFKSIKKDGTFFWVDSSISPIKKEFKTVGYKAIRFDISAKIIAQQKLERDIDAKVHELEVQSKRFEFAINSSRDGFWDFDIANQEFYLSEGWKKRLGFGKDEEITYLKYLELIPDKYKFEHHKAMHDMLDEYPKDLEYIHFKIRYPLITKNGEKLLIEDVGDAFFDADNQPICITGFHRNITEQDRQNKMIESQNRVSAMGEMIGNIAHQWRQPIGAINNALNDLEFDIELEDLSEIPAEQYLATSKKVKEYTSHLSQTIDDFRKLSSDEKVKSKFMVKDVMDAAYNVVASEYDKYKISFILSSASECDCVFVSYERELMQVFLNILNNAKDVLVDKEIKNPSVIVSLSRDDSEVHINIHDNAGGIPDEIIEKIFDPYFTTKHESIGTGIGLYMSKKIILEHFNGSLSVTNEGEGAKFCISLPRQI